jgi:sensor c-di-GMP phosphodiesterase-like protein
VESKNHHEQTPIPSLGQRLSWIWLICGLGLLLMGLSSQWNESAFQKPEDKLLFSHTGLLQQVTFSAPTKSPTVVEMIVYNKEDGLKHGYLRYGYHAWEEQLKPYIHQDITLWADKYQQIWQVQQGTKTLLSSQTIEQRLQSMKQAQQVMAEKIGYAGLLMVLVWLFFFRQRFAKKNQTYS